MVFKVTFRTRGLSTGWITQQSCISAFSAADAVTKLDGSLARLYKAGAWFVDWAIVKAEQVA